MSGCMEAVESASPPGLCCRESRLLDRGFSRFGGSWAAAAVVLAVVAASLQRASGAAASEFGSHPDEAAHLVTGLMMGEFLRAGDWLDPIGFFVDYYMHYPKVAIGHWPPVFYVVQGFWTTLFGSSRESHLGMMAASATALALLLFQAVRRRCSIGVAFGASVGLLLLPAIQRYTGSVMAELLVALFSFAAAESLARCLEAPSRRRSLWFGVWASAAILTKGNGLALALTPMFAVALSGRWSVLRRWDFYAAAAPVILVCLPFHLATLSMQQNGWRESSPGLEFTASASAYYSMQMLKQLGMSVFLLSVVGLLAEAGRLGGRLSPTTASMAALAASVWAFQVVVPCGLEWRHLVCALAPAVYLAALGFEESTRAAARLAGGRTNFARAGVTAAVVAAAVPQFFVPRKEWSGYGALVEFLGDRGEAVWLVSSDAVGEGMFVAEAALRKPQPSRVILRASKFLASSRWDGRNYQSAFDSSQQILEKLESAPVGYAIVDCTADVANAGRHHERLQEALASATDRWEPLGGFPLVRRGRRIEQGALVYRLRNHDVRRSSTIQVGMQEMLGGRLEMSNSSKAVWRR